MLLQQPAPPPTRFSSGFGRIVQAGFDLFDQNQRFTAPDCKKSIHAFLTIGGRGAVETMLISVVILVPSDLKTSTRAKLGFESKVKIGLALCKKLV
jgi:hypothetical protein